MATHTRTRAHTLTGPFFVVSLEVVLHGVGKFQERAPLVEGNPRVRGALLQKFHELRSVATARSHHLSDIVEHVTIYDLHTLIYYKAREKQCCTKYGVLKLGKTKTLSTTLHTQYPGTRYTYTARMASIGMGSSNVESPISSG